MNGKAYWIQPLKIPNLIQHPSTTDKTENGVISKNENKCREDKQQEHEKVDGQLYKDPELSEYLTDVNNHKRPNRLDHRKK